MSWLGGLRSLSLAALFGCVLPLLSWAEEEVEAGKEGLISADAGAQVDAEPGQSSRGTGSLSLDELFYSALDSLVKKNFGRASDLLLQLNNKSLARGNTGLSEFSFELLKRAGNALSEGQLEEASFMVRKAVQLSPRDGRVYLVASSFGGAVGRGTSISYFLSSLKYLPTDYRIVAGVLLNLTVSILVALYFAFFVVCVVQLTRHSPSVFAQMSRVLPSSIRGILSAPLFLSLLLLPFLGGLCTVLAVWSLILSVSVRVCRWLGVLSGVLIVAWGLSLDVWATMGTNLNSRLHEVLEASTRLDYLPRSVETLTDAVNNYPDDPILLFSLAAVLQREGRWAEAESALLRARPLLVSKPELGRAVYVNLGALHYATRRFELAKGAFEQALSLGNPPFEVLYNLGLVHIALLDTEGYRKYYAMATDEDRDRFMELEAVPENEKVALTLGLPRMVLASRLFDPVFVAKGDLQAEIVNWKKRVVRAMFLSSSGVWLLIFGGATLSVSLFLQIGQRVFGSSKRLDLYASGEHTVSAVWMLLPGGAFAAGSHPVLGAVLIAVVFSSFTIALDGPIRMLKVLPMRALSESATLGFAVVVLIVVLAITMIYWQRSGPMPQEEE